MFELVPSEYLRAIWKDNHFELSDFNKATLIWNMYGKNQDEKLSALKEISESTADAILKQQILERLTYEDDKTALFQYNKDGRYVYVVLDEYGCGCGYFAKYEMAYEYGIGNAVYDEEDCFSIEKQLIVSDKNDMTVRESGRTNWNLFPEEKKVGTRKYDGEAISKAYYTADGVMQRVWSNEMSDEAEAIVDYYRSDRFEFQFLNIPFEGKIGWSVCDIRDGTFGVLMQDTDGWNQYLKDILEKGLFVDYGDVQVMVLFLTPQGLWSHEHINPIYLELDRPRIEGDEKKQRAFAYAMEAFTEYQLSKNYGPRQMWGEKTVIKYSKEYRDACLEEEMKKEKDKHKIFDWAKSVDDIII